MVAQHNFETFSATINLVNIVGISNENILNLLAVRRYPRQQRPVTARDLAKCEPYKIAIHN